VTLRCAHRKTLDTFARHYQTNEPLPEDMFATLLAVKKHHAGLIMLRQLYFGQLDLALHSGSGETARETQKRMADRYTVLPPLPNDGFLCSFQHIFAGGYAAGYYSYKWSEVMSQDAFGAFEEAGLDDDAAMAQVGAHFKDTVLGMGGSQHPSDVYRAFRGRDPAPEALLRHSGLSLLA
jgi:oligopeptidase A